MASRIYFVTSNLGKFESAMRQFARLGVLGVTVARRDPTWVEPQARSVEAVALAKARQAFQVLKQPLVTEDSGLAIDELGGFPGPYLKYALETLGAEGLARMVRDLPTRRCRIVSALAYIDSDGVPRTFVDDSERGEIAAQPGTTLPPAAWSELWRVFIPAGHDLPLSELPADTVHELERLSPRSVFARFTEWMLERDGDGSGSGADPGLARAYSFSVPRHRIALRPGERGRQRLLVYDRRADRVDHRRFDEIGDLLPPRALLVINNSKVVRAALRKRPEDGTYLHVMRPQASALDPVECLCPWKPAVGEIVPIHGGTYRVTGAPVPGRDIRTGAIVPDDPDVADLHTFLERYGALPIPIYVNAERPPDRRDETDYQNCYARVPGSIECPTAGLHFYPELMRSLEHRGFEFVEITLHIGYGTWKSFRCERVEDHEMDAEELVVSAETLTALHRAGRDGRPVVAVGTTSVRTCETLADEILTGDCPTTGLRRETTLFVRPPYRPRVVDVLLTNFTYPRTPIMAMAAAFCEPGGTGGLATLKRLYDEALERDYEFYTYGDSILLR